jgi:hypothetical protein
MTDTLPRPLASKRQRYQGVDALAVQRLLARLPAVRFSALDRTALAELRGALSSRPAILSEPVRDCLFRIIQPGRAMTAETVAQLMDSLDLPHAAEDCERIAAQLAPRKNVPRTYRALAVLPLHEKRVWSVEEVLLRLRQCRVRLSLNALLDLLRNIVLQPERLDDVAEDLIVECVHSKTVSIGKIIEMLEEKSIPADLPLVLELHLAIKAGRAKNKTVPLRDEDIARIKAYLGSHLPTYAAVKKATLALDYNPGARALRQIAQALRQNAPTAKTMLAVSPNTDGWLTLIANRTGLQRPEVIEHALVLAAQAMVRAGKAQFPVDLRQHLVRETIHAQFRALPAEKIEVPILN